MAAPRVCSRDGERERGLSQKQGEQAGPNENPKAHREKAAEKREIAFGVKRVAREPREAEHGQEKRVAHGGRGKRLPLARHELSDPQHGPPIKPAHERRSEERRHVHAGTRSQIRRAEERAQKQTYSDEHVVHEEMANERETVETISTSSRSLSALPSRCPSLVRLCRSSLLSSLALAAARRAKWRRPNLIRGWSVHF
jgi:hypothetical protein